MKRTVIEPCHDCGSLVFHDDAMGLVPVNTVSARVYIGLALQAIRAEPALQDHGDIIDFLTRARNELPEGFPRFPAHQSRVLVLTRRALRWGVNHLGGLALGLSGDFC